MALTQPILASIAERYMGYSDPSIYARFYLLNVTNVEDVRHGGIPALVCSNFLAHQPGPTCAVPHINITKS